MSHKGPRGSADAAWQRHPMDALKFWQRVSPSNRFSWWWSTPPVASPLLFQTSHPKMQLRTVLDVNVVDVQKRRNPSKHYVSFLFFFLSAFHCLWTAVFSESSGFVTAGSLRSPTARSHGARITLTLLILLILLKELQVMTFERKLFFLKKQVCCFIKDVEFPLLLSCNVIYNSIIYLISNQKFICFSS